VPSGRGLHRPRAGLDLEGVVQRELHGRAGRVDQLGARGVDLGARVVHHPHEQPRGQLGAAVVVPDPVEVLGLGHAGVGPVDEPVPVSVLVDGREGRGHAEEQPPVRRADPGRQAGAEARAASEPIAQREPAPGRPLRRDRDRVDDLDRQRGHRGRVERQPEPVAEGVGGGAAQHEEVVEAGVLGHRLGHAAHAHVGREQGRPERVVDDAGELPARGARRERAVERGGGQVDAPGDAEVHGVLGAEEDTFALDAEHAEPGLGPVEVGAAAEHDRRVDAEPPPVAAQPPDGVELADAAHHVDDGPVAALVRQRRVGVVHGEAATGAERRRRRRRRGPPGGGGVHRGAEQLGVPPGRVEAGGRGRGGLGVRERGERQDGHGEPLNGAGARAPAPR
jgi:hypothetical protein